MRHLFQLAQQCCLSLGVLRLFPLVDLGIDDSNTLGIELLGIDPSKLRYGFVTLSLEGLRDLSLGTFVLHSLQSVQEYVFAIYKNQLSAQFNNRIQLPKKHTLVTRILNIGHE